MGSEKTEDGGSAGCPDQRTCDQEPPASCPASASLPTTEARNTSCPVTDPSPQSKCPVSPESRSFFGMANPSASAPSHEDPIDPSNQMPPANQMPAPNQKGPLPTHRQVSSIPRGAVEEEDARWVYPSQQMFFNAMRRKGWDPEEKDMSAVVAIHNFVNEQTWGEVLRWEKLHKSTCAAPKLLKFQGRPQELSPKARFFTWLGYAPPFDRHDWIVDRCGTHVRYVIDFYPGPECAPGASATPRVAVDCDRPVRTPCKTRGMSFACLLRSFLRYREKRGGTNGSLLRNTTILSPV
eukprot:Rmarinus@m.23798